jgi:hypothetical protein
MTAKRGTLWKTSWRRQKPVLSAAPVSMWFFNTFQTDTSGRAWYQQPLDTPGIGDVSGASFWVGMIGAAPTSGIYNFGVSVVRADSPPNSQNWELSDRVDGFFPVPIDFNTRLVAGSAPFPVVDTSVVTLGTVLPVIQATVAMFITENQPPSIAYPLGSRRESLWVDGHLRQTKVFGTPYVATATRRAAALPCDGYLNSWAGGNAIPTNQEILDWFSASRYASPFPVAQDIPGKTLDRFDAGAVPATVPSKLVNLSVGQNMLSVSEGTSPAFATSLFDAAFAY